MKPFEIHIATCGPVWVWVVCVDDLQGLAHAVGTGSARSEAAARQRAGWWLLDELATLERAAEKHFAGSDRRYPYLPTFRGVPIVAVEVVAFDDLRAWPERVRAAIPEARLA